MRVTHITGTYAASWTLCGIRISTAEALPYVNARHVATHRERRPDMTFCDGCEAEMMNALAIRGDDL